MKIQHKIATSERKYLTEAAFPHFANLTAKKISTARITGESIIAVSAREKGKTEVTDDMNMRKGALT